MRRVLSWAPLGLAVAFPFVMTQACGPFLYPDVFVRTWHADKPKAYAAGQLGVLLPTYPRADLAVAYRYLNGGKLTAAEQQGYAPVTAPEELANDDESYVYTPNPPGPADEWVKARNQFAAPLPRVPSKYTWENERSDGSVLAASYENCQGDAFVTAAKTLESRAKAWGAKSAALADWIKGQDAVFAHCADQKAADPVAAPGDAPALLRQDRAYQQAAARFYSGRYDEARAAFEAIAADPASPWHGISSYVVARALVRQAFLKADGKDYEIPAKYDAALMAQAQQRLERLRRERPAGLSVQAVEGLLSFVRIRTETDARLREIATAVAGPKSDANYAQDLDDLTWILNSKLDALPVREDEEAYLYRIQHTDGDTQTPRKGSQTGKAAELRMGLEPLRATAPLLDWLVTMQSPAADAKVHALAEWKRTGSLPWQVAATMKARGGDAEAVALIEAAALVAKSSPAWATLGYHRLRLMIERGQLAEARKALDADLPSVAALGSESALNLYSGLRMRTGTTLDEALGDAPRRILMRASQQQSALIECLEVKKNPKRSYDCQADKSPVALSADSAEALNALPVDQLARAAESGVLPATLRQPVTLVAWVRAALLGNEPVAARMLPLLPAKLRQQAGGGPGLRRSMAILRNPGLRPYLDGGVQRAQSYDFVESYGDNWWCREWSNGYSAAPKPISSGAWAFLTPAERAAATSEIQQLQAMGSGEERLGAEVVAYAQAHPDDPDIPEALFLTLRAIRYGCFHGWENAESQKDADKIGAIARAVGALMRRRYAASPWTKKATPYVWPAEVRK